MFPGYSKATSLTLPEVDLDMLICYIKNSDSYVSVEIKGVKTVRLVVFLLLIELSSSTYCNSLIKTYLCKALCEKTMEIVQLGMYN